MIQHVRVPLECADETEKVELEWNCSRLTRQTPLPVFFFFPQRRHTSSCRDRRLFFPCSCAGKSRFSCPGPPRSLSFGSNLGLAAANGSGRSTVNVRWRHVRHQILTSIRCEGKKKRKKHFKAPLKIFFQQFCSFFFSLSEKRGKMWPPTCVCGFWLFFVKTWK